MATTKDFLIFVCENIPDFYNVRYKKMFGEYIVYLNDKPVLLLCDNCTFVKKLPQLEHLMEDAQVGKPYKNAKDYYILDVENRNLFIGVIAILEEFSPKQKSKKVNN